MNRISKAEDAQRQQQRDDLAQRGLSRSKMFSGWSEDDQPPALASNDTEQTKHSTDDYPIDAAVFEPSHGVAKPTRSVSQPKTGTKTKTKTWHIASSASEGVEKKGRSAAFDEIEWWLSEYRAGRRKPVAVRPLALPPNASESLRQVAEFVALLSGLRYAANNDEAMTLGRHFIGGELGGMHSVTVGRALDKLVEHGSLTRVGKLPYAKNAKLRAYWLYEPLERLPFEVES